MRLTGEVVMPEELEYDEARTDFNTAIQKYPCIINFCYTKEDVINALCYARHYEIPFRVRSGRHDYEGNANTNGGLIIDISQIDFIDIDYYSETATLGGGITSGKMYKVLAGKGYTIPAGTCADVGFGSLTTCGGVGYAARYLGLACDNLLEIEMVDAQGEVLIANENEHEDLFWAVRGGLAANFGIVVSLTYCITPVRYASTYVISWEDIYFKDVLQCWQSLTPYADYRLSTSVSFGKRSDGSVYLVSTGQFFGSPKELRQIIKPLIHHVPILSLEIEELPYNEVVNKWNSECTPPENFKATGSFINRPLLAAVLEDLAYAIDNNLLGSEQFFEFIGLNGAVSKVGRHETAFVHRDALYLLEVKAVFDDLADENINIDWVEDVKARLDEVGEGNYRGFADFSLEDWAWQYYGENYERLVKVKHKYDPQNIFCFRQSIE